MSQETALDSAQSQSPDAAVEIAAPSRAVAAGPDEAGRAQTDAEVAEGEATGAEDLQPTSSQPAPGSSELTGQNSEADSQSAQGCVNADSPAAPDAPAFSARQVGAARRFGLAEEDLVVLEALGRTGKGLLERLARADSDLSRRYSRLGRAEQDGAVRAPARVSPVAPGRPADEGAAADPGATGQATAAAPTAANGAAVAPDPAVAPDQAAAPAPTAAHSAAVAPAPGAAPDLPEELERLRGQVSQLLRETQEAQAARESADAERFFAQLDGDAYPQLGRGPSEKLAEDSPQRAGRAALLVKAREIRSGHQAVHGLAMEVEESLREALAVVWPGAAAQAERRRLARQLRLREAGLIARPTQRGGAGLESPADRTARALEEWQSRRGVRFFEE